MKAAWIPVVLITGDLVVAFCASWLCLVFTIEKDASKRVDTDHRPRTSKDVPFKARKVAVELVNQKFQF